MNPRTTHRRTFRRIHVLPSLLTLGNFACGFIAVVLCLNALFFATRAQLMEERPGKAEAAVRAPAPGGDTAVFPSAADRALRIASAPGNRAPPPKRPSPQEPRSRLPIRQNRRPSRRLRRRRVPTRLL